MDISYFGKLKKRGGRRTESHIWCCVLTLKALRKIVADDIQKHPDGRVVSTLDHKVLDSNPAMSRIQLMTVWGFIAQSLLLSTFRHLDMT